MTIAEDDSAPPAAAVAVRTGISVVLTVVAGVTLPLVALGLVWFSSQATSPRYWDAGFGRYIPDTRVWWWSTAASCLLTLGFLVLSFRRRRASGRWWIWPLSATVFMIIAWEAGDRMVV
ncbi:hypothetical protein SAMN05443287_107202 [Micromonospora phaseoli]|uniref:Uncharacterized protein n=1 Tax=Micromonospora phaseoli TaxID=1144548 RepID=A0A1H7BQN6_9ACTN|nr:hypothetical protein [Micromonospora phaseoli]PZV95022.1 hypothetical protein CLV64_108160 [Micromonospora phaseoli]GIJ79553.1 hypothetical protein Xph01_39850 [Micromonospora phaseoli]SEJ75715.1 hypothetical protein SAMN05443287_107202 [Micromonospora phaseoli]